jgi:hypothetical protein
MDKEKQKLKALKAITAWRQLDALGLLNNEERNSIKDKLMAVYGKYLTPLRTKKKQPFSLN